MNSTNSNLYRHLAPNAIALLLCALGMLVLISWHSPHLFKSIYPYATLMAYNTAIGFLGCGIGLYAITIRQWRLTLLASLVVVSIGLLTLLDLFSNTPINTSTWFITFLSEPPLRLQPSSPTTSLVFIISGVAILLSFSELGVKMVIAMLLCALILFLTLTAVIGQRFGVTPDSAWLGIKMAPQSAIGFVLFVSGLIFLRFSAATLAFNRLSVFSRLATGYVFLSVLFIGIGSIGSSQINSVALFTQQLYEEPIQVNNALLRLKGHINKLNRQLKDIAVNPHLANEFNIPESLIDTRFAVTQEIDLISRKLGDDKPRKLHATFNLWQKAVSDTYAQLVAGNVELYREKMLVDTQSLTLEIEHQCEELIQQQQDRVQTLNKQVKGITDNAGYLMLFILSGFLILGFLVAAIITRSLNGQLQTIRNTMEQLARGDSSVLIPFHDAPHEMGSMAKTLVVFAENIEARKRSAQQLIQHQTELESSNSRLAQTNKELETFAYVASHDLKSPLRGIAQLSTWIEEDLAEKEFAEVGKHTQMLRNRIQRMEKLLDDMLIFYRAGKTDGKFTVINLAQMAAELFEIQNTKAGLRLELGENLPTFETLSTPFEQVIRNLFSNAIKHHDLDQGVIRLECTNIRDKFYEISVSDDGPGIPEKFQERVFGMFQTLKPRDELEGSGMGLALIKKLVEAYGGSIKLSSQGRGCRFTFTWPQVIKEKASL
ncbi:HAMP domain-containing protein [Cellvibrio sp. KY-GH-1]|nr:HAMP domain-containing protein [Cellvibrio sp. KY-GH-1]